MKRVKRLIPMTTLMILGTLSGEAKSAASVAIDIAALGVDGKISAQVEANGDVKIDDYPKFFAGSLKLIAMNTSAFGRTLNDAACQSIAARAQLAGSDAYPADLRQLAKDSVRKDNSFMLDAAFVSFFATSEFTQAAKIAAEAAGVHASSYQIVNPLLGRELDLSVEFSDQAISQQIGDLEFSAHQLKNVLQTASGLATGRSQGEISAADLMCDLRSGAARVTTKVIGSVDAPSTAEPLFEVRVAEALYRGMKTRLANLPANYSVAQKLVAGGVAAKAAADEAGADLDAIATGVIGQKLFDGRSGALVEVANGRLQQVLSVPRDGGERFEGQGSLVLN